MIKQNVIDFFSLIINIYLYPNLIKLYKITHKIIDYYKGVIAGVVRGAINGGQAMNMLQPMKTR
jgi:hypothetical protein